MTETDLNFFLIMVIGCFGVPLVVFGLGALFLKVVSIITGVPFPSY
jgi:hypothetical protein